MPAITPIPPEVLFKVLVEAGWSAHGEDHFNWVLQRDGQPLVVPKHGGVVSLTVMENVLERAGFEPGRYFEFLEKVGYSYYQQ